MDVLPGRHFAVRRSRAAGRRRRGTLLLAVLCGTVAALGLLLAPALQLLLGCTVVVALLWLTAVTVLSNVLTGPRPAAPDTGSMQELLGVLPLGMLLAEWRAVEQQLQAQPVAPQALWQFRTGLLEELLRRDPASVARWWDADPVAPDRHPPGKGEG